MDTFLLTMLLVFAIAMGGRDQLLVVRLREALGGSAGLLMLGALVAAISAGVMAYAGSAIAALLPSRASNMLVAFALGAAAIELAWPVREKAIGEPTRSFGAIGLVLLAKQMGDGARFVIFALAAAADYPWTAAIGGAFGGAAALTLAWAMGASLTRKFPLQTLRRVFAACLIIAALLIGLNARYAYF